MKITKITPIISSPNSPKLIAPPIPMPHRYEEVIDSVETAITSRLRDQLATARNAAEMFRIFSRFNALFVRPHIRSAIREYQTQLISRVKDDIDKLHEKFKVSSSQSPLTLALSLSLSPITLSFSPSPYRTHPLLILSLSSHPLVSPFPLTFSFSASTLTFPSHPLSPSHPLLSSPFTFFFSPSPLTISLYPFLTLSSNSPLPSPLLSPSPFTLSSYPLFHIISPLTIYVSPSSHPILLPSPSNLSSPSPLTFL